MENNPTSELPIQSSKETELKSLNPFSLKDLPSASEKRLVWLFGVAFVLTLFGSWVGSTPFIFKILFIPIGMISLYASQSLLILNYIDDMHTAYLKKKYKVSKIFVFSYTLSFIACIFGIYTSQSVVFSVYLIAVTIILAQFIGVSLRMIITSRPVAVKRHKKLKKI